MTCPACGGAVKPLFSSFYCVAGCDRVTSRAIMSGDRPGELRRFDGKRCVYITDPNGPGWPEKPVEFIWVDKPGTGTLWPDSPAAALAYNSPQSFGNYGGWCQADPVIWKPHYGCNKHADGSFSWQNGGIAGLMLCLE